jgi:hypothetical protein
MALLHATCKNAKGETVRMHNKSVRLKMERARPHKSCSNFLPTRGGGFVWVLLRTEKNQPGGCSTLIT